MNYVFFYFSLCGFSNPLSIKSLDHDDITFMEEYVRVDLMQVLQDKAQERNHIFDEAKCTQFFGTY